MAASSRIDEFLERCKYDEDEPLSPEWFQATHYPAVDKAIDKNLMHSHLPHREVMNFASSNDFLND